MLDTAVITIGIPPEIHLGPLTLAWHGMTIAVGIFVGGLAASRWLRARKMDIEPLYSIALLLIVGGIVGGRLFYVVEHGGPLFGNRGLHVRRRLHRRRPAPHALPSGPRVNVSYLDGSRSRFPSASPSAVSAT